MNGDYSRVRNRRRPVRRRGDHLPGGLALACLLMGFGLLLSQRFEPQPNKQGARRGGVVDPTSPVEQSSGAYVVKARELEGIKPPGYTDSGTLAPLVGGIRNEVEIRLRREDILKGAGY